MKTKVTVSAQINADIKNVWEKFTQAKHIVNWNFAGADWHCPKAENDFRENGTFSWRMEAKDGSFGFDLKGVFSKIEFYKAISYVLEDGRKVELSFKTEGNSTQVVEIFEAETENSLEMQQRGWQMILDNFKKYCESK